MAANAGCRNQKMGQRANYILIENNSQSIHYNHWRANCIVQDLYLGEKRFIEFVRTCKPDSEIMNEVWIEGCVIINLPKKELHFWSLEFEQTSAVEIYLRELHRKWRGWSIELLRNRMYDAEKVLNIDYISIQELVEPGNCTIDEIIADKIGEWQTALVIIKTNAETHTTLTGNIHIGGILNFGEPILEVLMAKPQYELPNESDYRFCQCIVIDAVSKEIIIDSSEFGLWEQTYKKWDGYKFKMGDFGYIGVLKLAGFETEKVIMPPDKAWQVFNDMVKQSNTFNPLAMAKLLMREGKDIKFSPDFFDNVSPKKTIFERVKNSIKKSVSKK